MVGNNSQGSWGLNPKEPEIMEFEPQNGQFEAIHRGKFPGLF
jgi:hypothetical protein